MTFTDNRVTSHAFISSSDPITPSINNLKVMKFHKIGT